MLNSDFTHCIIFSFSSTSKQNLIFKYRNRNFKILKDSRIIKKKECSIDFFLTHTKIDIKTRIEFYCQSNVASSFVKDKIADLSN